MIPLHKVFMAPEASASVVEVLHSGYLGEGEVVKEFEKELGRWISCPAESVVTVNSATSALTLAIRSLDLEHGGEVLTTPLTCLATQSAIVNNGQVPVWVDVDPATMNFDLEDLERKITPKTNVILAVHFGGNPIDLDCLYGIAQKHGLIVVEDCAHALGARWKNQHLGTHGHHAAFSFQAIKPLTTGDGGMLIGPDADRARLLRWYGINREDRNQPVKEVGFKFHMNDLNASLGLANLPYLLGIIRQQQENGDVYDYHFGVSRPLEANPAFYLYPILVERRSDFIRAMRDRGVETGPVHTRNDVLSCFAGIKNETPKLDQFHNQMVCIPVGWWVKHEERDQILTAYCQGW